ncbi:MAG: DNA polymerase IV [Spirochaetales bacterium]|nr:DNA polymerase IV [Spirochaetales bacterium]
MKVKEKRIFHVDLDAFYASVEQRDHPELKEKPVIIGARPGTRGVVSACSYEARAFGVHSAMPISEAYRRCPRGVYLPVNMARYQEVSIQIMDLFETFTPAIQQISVDEAFLDMTGTERLFGTTDQTGKMIKKQVLNQTGLVISVGIAANRYIAKLASDFDKPDGLTIVIPGEEEAFIEKLELKDLWGIGTKTLARLSDLNINTITDLKALDEENLRAVLGPSSGSFLYKISRGIDPGIMNESVHSRSLSNEITFEKDTADRFIMENVLLELAHQISFRAMKHGWHSKTVVLKLRQSDFSTTTAQISLQHNLTSAEEIFHHGLDLLKKRWDGHSPVRLIGLGLASVQESKGEHQGELFENEWERQKKVENAVFDLKQKGQRVVKASLLKNRKKPMKD